MDLGLGLLCDCITDRAFQGTEVHKLEEPGFYGDLFVYFCIVCFTILGSPPAASEDVHKQFTVYASRCVRGGGNTQGFSDSTYVRSSKSSVWVPGGKKSVIESIFKYAQFCRLRLLIFSAVKDWSNSSLAMKE